ncbi:MAG: LemA family protein [Firmicutes bacterium]|nr:LemA family protein [Bacillota bacterium]
MTILFIIIGIVVLIAIYAIGVQRNLVGLSERRGNALSSIGVQQQSRWDALTQLAKTVKGYAKHESEALTKIIGMRSNAKPQTAKEVEANDQQFSRAIGDINVVVEQYPDLKASPLYQELMGSINGYENQVRMARMVYNDTTTKYNQVVKSIPSSIFAPMFGFKAEDYIETPTEKTDMPDLDI